MITIALPDCPWCDAYMEQLFNEGDFTEHVVTCDKCKRPVKVVGETTIVVYAEKQHHLHSVPLNSEKGNL